MSISLNRRLIAMSLAVVATIGLLMAEKSCDDGGGPWRQMTSTATR